MTSSKPLLCALAASALACGGQADDNPFASAGGASSASASSETSGADASTQGSSSSPGTDDESDSDEASAGDDPKFDVISAVDSSPQGDACKVADDMNAVGECEQSASPDSFEPVLQWSFGLGEYASVIPLVGNFTDDNDDGDIDLCDTPDVVVVSNPDNLAVYSQSCRVYVLDGATGAEHFVIPKSENISCGVTPAIGDIDGDGLLEFVSLRKDIGEGGLRFDLVAYEHDGSFKWVNPGEQQWGSQFERQTGAVAIHDLDADGSPELVFNHEVYDNEGNLLWEVPNLGGSEGVASTAVDLDGDGLMEVVTGHSAFRYDGSTYFDNRPGMPGTTIPYTADFDYVPKQEIFVTSRYGLYLLEHDGTIAWGPVTPTGVPAEHYLAWQRPATIHDFDGDGLIEAASSTRDLYSVFEGPDAEDVLWSVFVDDSSGIAGSTAFDFLGDGIAEAIYADEHHLRVYDGLSGAVELELERGSPTIIEYPVVADVDNDGSAEILVVSHDSGIPALQVFGDVEDRWIQARRIWNQHAYYVTNVREDGTIPQDPVNNWEQLNTFRTNAQIEGGDLCVPPEG